MRPLFISTERSPSAWEVWARCGQCDTYHGPIAVCGKRYDAERIVRALTREAESVG